MDTIDAPLGRREKRKLETRARIEEAAYALFKQQGVEDTSIEEICDRADVARRTFYGYYPNKHALLGGLGVSRLYNQSEPMLRQLMANYPSTRERLAAMIDYIESNFSGYEDFDRQLILLAPSTLANNTERQRQIGDATMENFKQLFSAGQEMGDTHTAYSPDILAAMVIGTLNMLTTNWAHDADFPVFAKLEEARVLFERVICK